MHADLLVIQETKMNEEDRDKYERKLRELLPTHVFAWNFCTRKKSYAGTLSIIRSDGSTTAGADSKGKQASLKSFFQPVGDAGDGKAPSKDAQGGANKGGVVLKHMGVTMGLPTLTDEDGAEAIEARDEGRVITVEYDKFFGESVCLSA